MCLYNGMDEFTKSMLHFAFPFYLLLLVAFIILGAHKFNLRIFKVDFIAKRAVPVLATLMLLTYTNLIGLIIDSLRYTNVYTYTSQDTALQAHRVWLYQPTLQYFKGKHLALGIISIAVALLYIFPMTAFVLFGDVLRRLCIENIWFSHFLDLFHGAYCWPFGLWIGIRLLLRIPCFMLNEKLTSPKLNLALLLLLLVLYFTQVTLLRPFPNTPNTCLLYTSPSPRDRQKSRMPSSA